MASLQLATVEQTHESTNENGTSKKLIVNNFTRVLAGGGSKAAERRRALLEDQRALNPVTNVERVTSVTVDLDAVVIGFHDYTFDGKKTSKVNLLIINPTSAYTGAEAMFNASVGKNGESVPPQVLFDRANNSVSVPIGKASTFDATLLAWAKKGVALADCASFYEFKGPCAIDAKLALTSPGEQPEIHMTARVTVSVFAYLPPAEADAKNPLAVLRVPDSVGLSVRVHVLKKTGAANSPMLMRMFVENPRLLSLPVPTFAALKLQDRELTNKSKEGGKTKMVGSKIITVPCLCGIPALEERILELDAGTLATVAFMVKGDKVPTVYLKKDGNSTQVADLALTLNQWTGDRVSRHVVTTLLWSESLKIFGCTEIGNWGGGMGTALMKQTPTLFTGNVDHTESEAQMRAKTDETIESTMTLVALQPVADLPGAIANYFGVPVSAHFAAHMTLFQRRAGPNAPAAAHPLCTFAAPPTYKENTYNNAAVPMMIVLNECEPTARAAVFQDRDAGYLFFAVVGNKIMNDADHEMLQQLRDMQQRADYKGPLGEMLTWSNWNPSDPAKWKTAIYGKDARESECTVPDNHPVRVKNQGTFATNGTFYIYAISTTRYNAAVSKTTSSAFLAIGGGSNANDGKRKRDGGDDDDNDDNKTSNGAKEGRTHE